MNKKTTLDVLIEEEKKVGKLKKMALEPDGSRPPRSETNDLLWMAYRIRESYLEGLKQAREMLIGSPF